MPRYTKNLFFVCCILLGSHTSFSKESSSFKKLLTRTHIDASVGLGRMQYYSVTTHKDDPKATGLLTSLQGKGLVLPIAFSGHVDLGSKLRVGLGGALSINTIGKLEYKKHGNVATSYSPPQKSPYSLRPFFILGFKFIDNSILSALIDAHLGVDLMYSSTGGKTRYAKLGAKSLGLTLEGHISPYFRLFGRLSYDLSDDAFQFDEKTVSTSECKSVLLQFGFSLNYPEFRRCPVKGCKIERNHKHTEEVYRGTSIFTSRDAQGRRIYEK